MIIRLRGAGSFSCLVLLEPPGHDDQRGGVAQEEAHRQYPNMQGGDGEALPGTSAAHVRGDTNQQMLVINLLVLLPELIDEHL